MKKSQDNLAVIQNFILHLTHCSGMEDNFKEPKEYTPELLYKVAEEYIQESHTDGEENDEDHVVTFGAEGSYAHEDKEEKYEEYVVVVADYGENGTKTIATLDGAENLKAVQELLEVIKSPYEAL